ncbi:hypothetical protein BDY21DRAFT_368184 [Lineolata rhizophorae]|uniref:DUF427 domain-containing protein n=1 Tax=Lineolata rhizophorae TaxID=578093 RepID=A0A6A6PDI4_9PEZI|nr:hypothetical protein BDY21DRAFT_368184 [Lineolata rhizophorae]
MPHATAKVDGVTVAETDSYEVVEGNIYFPPSSVNKNYFASTDKHTTCPWKGRASYYTIDVNGTSYKDSAWYYPEPKSKASHIKNYVAFYTSKIDVTSE